jgi:hypothetical protein
MVLKSKQIGPGVLDAWSECCDYIQYLLKSYSYQARLPTGKGGLIKGCFKPRRSRGGRVIYMSYPAGADSGFWLGGKK